jgi:hypothetical protein
MPDEVRLWRVGKDESLVELSRAKLNLEERLEEWLERDISMLDPGLLVIGRQVETDFGGWIDLLCVDAAGDLVVVELKRGKTPREITAQALDYGSWVVDLSNERVTSIAEAHFGEGGFEEAFRQRFGAELPETLNGSHSMLIVGSHIDESSERIIKYLSDTHGVNINAATFQYFREADGGELVSRVFLIEPAQVELASRTKGTSKRRPRLTYEELEKQAAEAGVADLYGYGFARLDPLLKKHTTRSTIGFAGQFDESRKNVISFLPGLSSHADGLRYQLYGSRFATLAGLAEQELEAVLPAVHEPWAYEEGAGPDWEGFQGFITSREEIDRLAAALTKASVEAAHG